MVFQNRSRRGMRGARAAAYVRRPFDLSRGASAARGRAAAFCQEHVVVVVMHHIVSDGWSRRVLIREIGALYAAFVEGKPSPLAELAVQYADYAIWQRGWLQGEVLEQQLATGGSGWRGPACA